MFNNRIFLEFFALNPIWSGSSKYFFWTKTTFLLFKFWFQNVLSSFQIACLKENKEKLLIDNFLMFLVDIKNCYSSSLYWNIRRLHCIEIYADFIVLKYTPASLYWNIRRLHFIEIYDDFIVLKYTTTSLFWNIRRLHCFEIYDDFIVLKYTPTSLYWNIRRLHCIEIYDDFIVLKYTTTSLY